MDKRFFFFLIILLILAGLACNASGLSQETPPDEPANAAPPSDQTNAEDETADQAVTEGKAAGESAPADQPASQPSGQPIGIREGLASLNSFYLVMHNVSDGPTDMDHQEITIETRFDADNDARYVRTENVESSAEDPETYVSVQEQYQVGLETCSVSSSGDSSEAELSELTPLMRDMAESTANLFDITITVPDATLVGQETVNGIPSSHYTFRVTGLGDYSGSEVTMADGDYWVAEDGQYLVKYSLVLEVRTGPDGDPAAEVMHSEYHYDLTEVNQPQAIAIPPNCVAQPTS